MTLLEFARGPGLYVSLAVFAFGTAWRLFGVLRLPRMPDLSPAREGAPPAWAGAGRAVLRGLWPQRRFSPTTRWVALNGYVFHIGLALVVFGYAPHIAFVQRLTGLGWPALPDAVMYVAAAATIVALLLALLLRLTDPVRRMISNADDMISWTLVFLPMFTGMALIGEPSAAIAGGHHVTYAGPLALHLLSLQLLLLWFPFGKLMHAFLFVLSRGATGMRLSHRGVSL